MYVPLDIKRYFTDSASIWNHFDVLWDEDTEPTNLPWFTNTNYSNLPLVFQTDILFKDLNTTYCISIEPWLKNTSF